MQGNSNITHSGTMIAFQPNYAKESLTTLKQNKNKEIKLMPSAFDNQKERKREQKNVHREALC